MGRPDPHSVHDDAQPQVIALDWRATLDAERRILSGEARLTLDDNSAPRAASLELDTRDLHISTVTDGDGAPLAFSLGRIDPVLGSALRIELPKGTRALTVRYRTSPNATGLAWLEADGAPFVYTQAQPIHARSFVPLPDSPSVRLRWSLALTVPEGLTVVSSAVDEPVPPYLIALAAGKLAAREISPRTRVWATAALVDEAARGFGYVPRLLAEAEALLGPYPFQRFDLLLLPSAFPYGGMESPRVAFLSPSLLAAGDGGLAVLAHELSHAWLGNLVTCASAEHFWLNEGFAVWAERRLIETLRGAEAAACEAALGRRTLDDTLAELAAGPLTRLHTPLAGVAPDEGLSRVAYEKGALLLTLLEREVGRARFDAFVRDWIATHRGRAVTSAGFLAFARAQLGAATDAVQAERFISEPGLPDRAPATPPLIEETPCAGASTAQWRLYLESRPPSAEECADLERSHALSAAPDLDLRAAFLAFAVAAGWPDAAVHAEALCAATGRIAVLLPVYRALARGPDTRTLAGHLYQKNRSRYLFAARRVLEGMLRHHGVATVDVNLLTPKGLKR